MQISHFFTWAFTFFALCFSVHAQYIEDSQPVESIRHEGFYANFGVSLRNVGLSRMDLTFGNTQLEVRPGTGFEVHAGTALMTEIMDFELALEESIGIGYSAVVSNAGSATSFFSFFKTNLISSVYGKIPVGDAGVILRLGGGPLYSFPGRLKLKLDGNELGYASYEPTFGYHLGSNLAVYFKKVMFSPGLDLTVLRYFASKITYDENTDDFRHINASNIQLNLAVYF